MTIVTFDGLFVKPEATEPGPIIRVRDDDMIWAVVSAIPAESDDKRSKLEVGDRVLCESFGLQETPEKGVFYVHFKNVVAFSVVEDES